RQYSPGNVPNELNAAYYARRAKGGVGLIITEGTLVGHKAANGFSNVPHFYGAEALAGWKEVVTAVHAARGKIVPQLWHVGGIRRPGQEGPEPELPGYSPSGMAKPGKVTGHAMTLEDIQETVQAFIDSAVHAKELGFDGVEIHGAHGYLIDQFFWEGTNQRDDNYGGSMHKRSSIAIEIVKGIRAACGDDFPIILRFSQWKQQDYSAKLAQTPEELQDFLMPLVDAGVDIFHCSTRRFWEPEFPEDESGNSDLNLAGWTQKLSGKPAITVGSIGLSNDFISERKGETFKNGEVTDIDNLIQRMNNHEFELAAVGRALISNPDWAEKIRTRDNADIKPYNAEDLKQLI
ncbi:MAG: NADH:flavin oxidoreductase, partial [Gammaproteobacteria bacterium]|nr:NADH:flavin oxidoreductase [Gammaproteobacteria bacterium]